MAEPKFAINRAKWLQHVEAWRATGLTQVAYCRDHKLNATTFSGWVNYGRNTTSTKAPLTTIPVVIQPHTPAAPATPSSAVLQHRTGWHLNLPADVQITWLARLLNELV